MLGSLFQPQGFQDTATPQTNYEALRELDKQQMMAAALRKDALGGKAGGMAGRVYVGSGIGEGLGSMAEAYGSARMEDEAMQNYLKTIEANKAAAAGGQ